MPRSLTLWWEVKADTPVLHFGSTCLLVSVRSTKLLASPLTRIDDDEMADMMTDRERRDALKREAEVLHAKGENLTDKDVERIPVLAREFDALDARIQKQDEASAALARFKSGSATRDQVVKGASVGRGRVSPAFIDAVTKSFTRYDQNGNVMKAIVPGGQTAFDFTGPILTPPEAPLSMVDLVNVQQITVPSGQMLQEVSHNFNVQSVPLFQQKPYSTIALGVTSFKVATLATMVTGIANQWWSDFSQIGPLLAERIGYGLQAELNSFILNGATAVEDGSAVLGLLNSPVTQQAYTTGPLETIATAVSNAEAVGAPATGIAMNPSDWLTIALMRSPATGVFLIGGPAEQAAKRLFGLPVVVDPMIPVGKAIIANWATVHLLQREQFHQEVFTQGQAVPPVPGSSYGSRTEGVDMVATNQSLVRAEGRYAIWLEQLPAVTIATLHS